MMTDYGGDAMYEFIDVRYQDHGEGAVDDVTLSEMILTGKVKQFFRPSEARWVDVEHDAIRKKDSGHEGPERRKPLQDKRQEQKPAGLLSRFHSHETEEKTLTAQDWFERGFTLLHTTGDPHEAIRAIAYSIQLDPSNAKAYLNRGMAYEQIHNVQQAFEDFSKAIQLLPHDGKAYYIRGMLLWRCGMDSEAITDLKASAELGNRFAIDFLKKKKIIRE